MVLVLAPIAFFAAHLAVLRPTAPRVVASSVSAALTESCAVDFVVDATTPLIAPAFGPGVSTTPLELQEVDSVCVARESATAVVNANATFTATATTSATISESKPRASSSSSSPPSILNKVLDAVRYASSRVVEIVSWLLFGATASASTSKDAVASFTRQTTASLDQESNLASHGIDSHTICIEAFDIPAPRPLHAPVSPAASLITLATGPTTSTASVTVRLHDRPHVHATADTCLITHDVGSSEISAIETSDNINVEAASDASPSVDTPALTSCFNAELAVNEAAQEVNNDEQVNTDEQVNNETNDEEVTETHSTPSITPIQARLRHRHHHFAQTTAATTAHPNGMCICADVPQTTAIAFLLAAQLLSDTNAVEALMCRIARMMKPKPKQQTRSVSPPQPRLRSESPSPSPFASPALYHRRTTAETETPRTTALFRIRTAIGGGVGVAARRAGRPKRRWHALLKSGQ